MQQAKVFSLRALEFENFGFCWGENLSKPEKTPEQVGKPNNKLNPHNMLGLGIQGGTLDIFG